MYSLICINVLQEHKVLGDNQFGLCKQQSCQTALFSLTEMYQTSHEDKYFGMAQLDSSKAFDLVNHALSLQKLDLHKCDGDTVTWFNSYLDSRPQRAHIKKKLSELKDITSCIPKGSIPLFLIYIN